MAAPKPPRAGAVVVKLYIIIPLKTGVLGIRVLGKRTLVRPEGIRRHGSNQEAWSRHQSLAGWFP
jgi:hypothetical protein